MSASTWQSCLFTFVEDCPGQGLPKFYDLASVMDRILLGHSRTLRNFLNLWEEGSLVHPRDSGSTLLGQR